MKADLNQAPCPIARALGAVGDCWSLLIIRDVMTGRRRFSEIQKNLGLAKNTLADRLRTLVQLDLLHQGPASDGSAYLEYALTQKGADLYLVLAALREWGERWQFGDQASGIQIVDRQTGRSVEPLQLMSADGRKLGPADLLLARQSDTPPS